MVLVAVVVVAVMVMVMVAAAAGVEVRQSDVAGVAFASSIKFVDIPLILVHSAYPPVTQVQPHHTQHVRKKVEGAP
jgi:hypothetical protein